MVATIEPRTLAEWIRTDQVDVSSAQGIPRFYLVKEALIDHLIAYATLCDALQTALLVRGGEVEKLWERVRDLEVR